MTEEVYVTFNLVLSVERNDNFINFKVKLT